MFVEVGFLSERRIAALDMAFVRSLVGMNAEVVEEIVPFPENLGAAGRLAQHQFVILLV